MSRPTSHLTQKRQRLPTAAAVLLLVASIAGTFLWRSRDVQLLSVQTGSMAPAIQPGDAVLIRAATTDELKIGDVISFQAADKPTVVLTHRVSGFSGDGQVYTKGDANQAEDAPLDPSLLAGKVVQTLPNAGYGIDFMRSPTGLAVLVYLPALLVVAGEVRRLTIYFRPVYRLQPRH